MNEPHWTNELVVSRSHPRTTSRRRKRFHFPAFGPGDLVRPLGFLAAAALLAACAPRVERDAEGRGASTSPRPRPDLVETLRADLAAERQPADGGGRAWLDTEASTPTPLPAGESGRFEIVYEAGPLGVAEGGVVFLQSSSFWGWSPPQSFEPELAGYTEVRPESGELELEVETWGGGLLGARILGRALEPGERLRFVYGAGAAGARVDRYAEQESRIWIAVDGDGDGVRSLIAESPAVETLPRAPQRLVVTAPSVVRPGETFRVTLAVTDLLGNAGQAVEMPIDVESRPAGLDLPDRLVLEAGDRGSAHLEAAAPVSGVFRIGVRSGDGLEGTSPPIFVTPKLPRVAWADLHGHSNLSDGTQTPEGYFRYARDVAGLDVVALTDHDHWGMRPLATHPEIWERIRAATIRFHQPGRFVTLLGYEWTSWIHGHRHVLYFSQEGRVLSSLDRRWEHPLDLWEALAGSGALTFAHHSAGEPIPTNWEIPPDPDLEPITEIVSVHGSSEAMDSPGVLRGPVPGNFARDALDRGYRLGFIGSGDSHDGHPGLAGIASPSAGLAALITDDLTRSGVREALSRRRVYATNGPRILLHASLDGQPMGSLVEPSGDGHELVALVLTDAPLSRIDLIRDGQVVESIGFVDDTTLHRLERQIEPLLPGGYLYLRAVQVDGGAAWSSPFFAAD